MPEIIRESDNVLFMPNVEFKCLCCKTKMVRGVRRTRRMNEEYRYAYSWSCECGHGQDDGLHMCDPTQISQYVTEMEYFGSSFMEDSALDRLVVIQDLLMHIIGGLLKIDAWRIHNMTRDDKEARRAAIQQALDTAPNPAARLLTVAEIMVALDGELGQDWAMERRHDASCSRWEMVECQSQLPL